MLSISIYEGALLAFAFFVGAVSMFNSRGVLWVVAIVVDLVLTTAYWKIGWPYAEVFAGLCDTCLCLGVYRFGTYRWELWLWRLYQGSVLVNILYFAVHVFGLAPVSQDVYSTVLEAINWVALLSIGAASARQIGRRRDDLMAFSPWHGRRLRGLVHPLYR